MNKGWGVIIGVVLLVIAVLLAGPLLVIWSINTLFPVAAVPYDIWTWLAVIILFGAVRTNVSYKRKD